MKRLSISCSSGPFQLGHLTVEINHGESAVNVDHPTPVNYILEPVKYGVTKEASLSANLSLNPSLQLGGKIGTQEDKFSQPVTYKYHENSREEGPMSALWQFCVKDK